jgi:L-ascorbate metabolism protein UlaG (beta-lactamase superfamily)
MPGMELTWYGRSCVRLKGRDAVVVCDPYQAVVGPTGRGITGVRSFRDEQRGAERGYTIAFVVELDGVHVVHLGDIAHTLTEEKLGDIGSVDIACVPIGGGLSPTKAAELVAQLDPKIVVPLPICETEEACEPILAKFLHEMGTAAGEPQPRLSITPSGLPEETTTVLLESRGKV